MTEDKVRLGVDRKRKRFVLIAAYTACLVCFILGYSIGAVVTGNGASDGIRSYVEVCEGLNGVTLVYFDSGGVKLDCVQDLRGG